VSLIRLTLVFLLAAVSVVAQRGKFTSPPADVSVTILDKKIRVDYYAPSAHERQVMGGLVPFGQVWCTGANWATKLTTDADLEMGGLSLPKGSYSIWTVPNEKEWTLIINRETGQFHLNYDQSQDLGRTKMAVKTLAAPVETFRVDLTHTRDKAGRLALVWEKTEASVDFSLR
jgi:hypothetical protein